jgi:hypothetical protein
MEILGGIALGFAIPAFVLGLQAATRIKELEKRLASIDGRLAPK